MANNKTFKIKNKKNNEPNEEKVIQKWQGILIIVGLLLLANPDIELISSIGSALMCIGYIPWGIKELKKPVANII